MIKGKRLIPLIYGGGQELGLRSGTENVPAISAFGAAAGEGVRCFADRVKTLSELNTYARELLSPMVRINSPDGCAAHILNITLPGIRSETMLNFLSGKGICVSAGSACSTHSKGVSRALTAFGLTGAEADSSLRISLSHENTKEQLDFFAAALFEGIGRLARVSK